MKNIVGSFSTRTFIRCHVARTLALERVGKGQKEVEEFMASLKLSIEVSRTALVLKKW
jgi:hypothetical protein